MCGIVGILKFDGRPVDKTELVPLNNSIVHRGPDDEGFFVDGSVGLAMRRLSIIDLAGGHQPQISDNGHLAIVFNGEIYNFKALRVELEALGHSFRTNSDTEVILIGYQKWGPDVFSRLQGMWGLAIWDREQQRLILSRDRLGKKQLYFALIGNALVFGSEMAALMTFDKNIRRLNLSAVGEFLTYSYVTGPRTALRDVKLFPQGQWAAIGLDGNMKTHTYWELAPNPSQDTPPSLAAASETAWQLLIEAVEQRLVSDVPIALMLSSGLDSSAIAWILRNELSTPMKTFSVGFDDAGFDESADAGAFARTMGLEWHRIGLDGIQVRDAFPHYLRHASSLQGNTAQMVYYFCSRAIHQAGFKVAINGNGGDELFAGYKTYRADTVFKFYRQIPEIGRKILHRLAQGVPTNLGRVSLDYQLKKFTECPYYSLGKAHGYWRTIFSQSELNELLVPEVAAAMGSFTRPYDNALVSLGAGEDPGINELEAADIKAWLQPMLPWMDNVSMANSVELRMPFLDHKLVDYVLTLPPEVLFRGWNLKRVMKAFLKDRLPDNVLHRSKAGTHLPISCWLNNELSEICDHGLTTVKRSGLVNPKVVDKLMDEHSRRRRDNTFKIWNLVMLGNWLEEFSVTC